MTSTITQEQEENRSKKIKHIRIVLVQGYSRCTKQTGQKLASHCLVRQRQPVFPPTLLFLVPFRSNPGICPVQFITCIPQTKYRIYPLVIMLQKDQKQESKRKQLKKRSVSHLRFNLRGIKSKVELEESNLSNSTKTKAKVCNHSNYGIERGRGMFTTTRVFHQLLLLKY